MSFFLGIYGSYSKKEECLIQSKFSPHHLIKESNFILGFDGIPETLRVNVDTKKGFVVCGIGISAEGNKILNSDDWKIILSNSTSNIAKLNGHFAAVSFDENQIILFNDTLGMREIYYFKNKNVIYFSTRLDFLSQLTNYCEPNIKTLSSSWLLTNHLGYGSLVKNIERLAPGGLLEIVNDNFSVSNPNSYCPKFANSFEDHNVKSILEELTLLPSKENKNLSLALSGGMDSRVLLAYLLMNDASFSVHTFGEMTQPDAVIAKNISDYHHIDHLFFRNEIPPKKLLIDYLRNMLGQTLLTMPASETLHLKNHAAVYSQNKFIIDGGYGEILRREFLNKVLLFDKEAVVQKDFAKLIPHLHSRRADIFKDEIVADMRINLIDELETACAALPDSMTIGVEHWLDFFAIKLKMPNVNGPGQAAMDALAPGYMPFTQKILLDAGFLLSASSKKNGKIFKAILSGNKLNLTKFPLVKNQITYPYGSSSLFARIFVRIKKQIGNVYEDPTRVNMLNLLEEFFFDLISSTEFHSCELYDLDKIKKIVNGYYSGNKSYALHLDWLLTFELWRQSLINTNVE